MRRKSAPCATLNIDFSIFLQEHNIQLAYLERHEISRDFEVCVARLQCSIICNAGLLYALGTQHGPILLA